MSAGVLRGAPHQNRVCNRKHASSQLADSLQMDASIRPRQSLVPKFVLLHSLSTVLQLADARASRLRTLIKEPASVKYLARGHISTRSLQLPVSTISKTRFVIATLSMRLFSFYRLITQPGI
jgi:hypothetical protein